MKEYMDESQNPDSYIDAQRTKKKDEEEKQVSAFTVAGRYALFDAGSADSMAAQCHGYHQRRGLLLRSSSDDENHERGLGQLLAHTYAD